MLLNDANAIGAIQSDLPPENIELQFAFKNRS